MIIRDKKQKFLFNSANLSIQKKRLGKTLSNATKNKTENIPNNTELTLGDRLKILEFSLLLVRFYWNFHTICKMKKKHILFMKIFPFRA